MQGDLTFDCQSTPGARCVKAKADMFSIPECVDGMSCSSDGKVLVDGKPCPGAHLRNLPDTSTALQLVNPAA